MICENCSSTNTETARFCRGCGTALPVPVSIAAPLQAASSSQAGVFTPGTGFTPSAPSAPQASVPAQPNPVTAQAAAAAVGGALRDNPVSRAAQRNLQEAREEMTEGPIFALAPGERVVSSHRLLKRRGPLGTIATDVFLTDSRLLYQARAKNVISASTVQREVQLADISGVSSGFRRGFGPLIGILLALGVLGSLTMLFSEDLRGVALVSLLLNAALIAAGFLLRQAELAVHPRQGELIVLIGDAPAGVHPQPLLVTAVNSIVRLFYALLGLVGIHYASEGAVGVSTSAMRDLTSELGARVLEIQSRGSLAGTR